MASTVGRGGPQRWCGKYDHGVDHESESSGKTDKTLWSSRSQRELDLCRQAMIMEEWLTRKFSRCTGRYLQLRHKNCCNFSLVGAPVTSRVRVPRKGLVRPKTAWLGTRKHLGKTLKLKGNGDNWSIDLRVRPLSHFRVKPTSP